MPTQTALNREEIRRAFHLAMNELRNRKGPAGNNIYRAKYLNTNNIVRLWLAKQNIIINKVNRSNRNRLNQAKNEYLRVKQQPGQAGQSLAISHTLN